MFIENSETMKMGMVSRIRSSLWRSCAASPFLQSHLSSIRFCSTRTTPKLFVSGLSRLTDNEKLKEAFSRFGRLVEAKVITDRASGRSKGFGFVTYASIEDAEKAKREMNARFLDGWVVFVDLAKQREYRPPPKPRQASSENGFRSNKTNGWYR